MCGRRQRRGGSARLLQACAFNFCADNGVVEEGVSQTGQEVTAAVVSNMTRGRSCSCLMAEKGRDRCVSDRYGNCL
ncbi:MAG: nicotinate-nucleotide--dimethylbenzimidazole phosphoribosyltransferase [Clostridium fessum]